MRHNGSGSAVESRRVKAPSQPESGSPRSFRARRSSVGRMLVDPRRDPAAPSSWLDRRGRRLRRRRAEAGDPCVRTRNHSCWATERSARREGAMPASRQSRPTSGHPLPGRSGATGHVTPHDLGAMRVYSRPQIATCTSPAQIAGHVAQGAELIRPARPPSAVPADQATAGRSPATAIAGRAAPWRRPWTLDG